MDEIIQLRNRDITKELFDRAQFLSWAEGGAMGDAGAVIIVTDDGKSYYCNWAYGDADPKLIIKACTLLKKFPDLPAEWEYHYLGMGNMTRNIAGFSVKIMNLNCHMKYMNIRIGTQQP